MAACNTSIYTRTRPAEGVRHPQGFPEHNYLPVSVAVTAKNVPCPPLVSTELARIETTHLTYDDPNETDREHFRSALRSRIVRKRRYHAIRPLTHAS